MDRGIGFYIGAVLAGAVIVAAILAIAAWVVTIGWNDLELYEFFNAEEITFAQAFGAVWLATLFGQCLGAGVRR